MQEYGLPPHVMQREHSGMGLGSHLSPRCTFRLQQPTLLHGAGQQEQQRSTQDRPASRPEAAESRGRWQRRMQGSALRALLVSPVPSILSWQDGLPS